MRSIVTAVIAAIEAVAVAFAGLLVVAIPALLLWIIGFGLAAEPSTVFGTIAGVWLLGHFVPLGFSLSAEAAVGFGLPPEELAFGITLAPLGLTVLTAALAARAGFRFGGRGGSGAAGILGGGAGFGLVAFAAAGIAGPVITWPVWQAAGVPALVYASVSGAAFLLRAAREAHPWWEAAVRQCLRGIEYLGGRSGALPGRAAETIRLAAAGLAALGLVAALGLAAAILLGYANVIELTQRLQLDPLGSILIFLVQLALLPVALVWSASWFTGAGFSIGAGSSVTPFESLLGPLPALPLFGAIPPSWGGLGLLAPALLVLAGIVVGALFARRDELRRGPWSVSVAIPVLSGVLIGAVVAGACALASGAIGPDRLQTTGSDPWVVGGLTALEIGVGLLFGVVVGRVDYARLRASLPEAVPAVASRLAPSSRLARGRRGSGSGKAAVASGTSADGGFGGFGGIDEGDGFGASDGNDGFDDVDNRSTVDLSDATDFFDAEVSGVAGLRDPDPDPEPRNDAGKRSRFGRRRASRPAGDPEPRNDRESVGDAEPAADPDPAADADPANSEAAGDSETEALLRAYSWDGQAAEETEPVRKRRGWRLPGRKQ